MKLVDILARELKVWPEGVSALQQGGITGWLRDENFNEIKPRIHVDLADDRGYPDSPAGFGSGPAPEWVYRSQWQAAVDALKAAENAIPIPSDEAVEAWLVSLEVPHGLEAANACRDIINAHKRKRDEAFEIQKIRDEIKWQKPQLGPCPVEQMYLLGYRKFEIMDN